MMLRILQLNFGGLTMFNFNTLLNDLFGFRGMESSKERGSVTPRQGGFTLPKGFKFHDGGIVPIGIDPASNLIPNGVYDCRGELTDFGGITLVRRKVDDLADDFPRLKSSLLLPKFHEIIRTELKAQGYSLSYFANGVGLSTSHAKKVLDGKRIFTKQRVKELVNVFGMRAEFWLMLQECAGK